MKTGADSRVTVKDSKLTAAEDLTISSKAESEIGSETGGALGVGINVGIADVSSKVEIQGTSVLTAEKDLAISAEGSNAIDSSGRAARKIFRSRSTLDGRKRRQMHPSL